MTEMDIYSFWGRFLDETAVSRIGCLIYGKKAYFPNVRYGRENRGKLQ